MVEWRENQVPNPVDKPEHWTMYVDGSLKLDGGGAGVLFISPRGEQLKYILQILWEVSNNEAEYEALLHGLRLAISLGIKRLLVYGDSLLVVQQVNKEWDCNKETMEAYVQEVSKLENKFSGLEILRVLREHNVAADVLSKLGSTRAQVPAGVFVQELKQPSICLSPQSPPVLALYGQNGRLCWLARTGEDPLSTSSAILYYRRGWTLRALMPPASCDGARGLS
jgi:ribonuclease HI